MAHWSDTFKKKNLSLPQKVRPFKGKASNTVESNPKSSYNLEKQEKKIVLHDSLDSLNDKMAKTKYDLSRLHKDRAADGNPKAFEKGYMDSQFMKMCEDYQKKQGRGSEA